MNTKDDPIVTGGIALYASQREYLRKRAEREGRSVSAVLRMMVNAFAGVDPAYPLEAPKKTVLYFDSRVKNTSSSP